MKNKNGFTLVELLAVIVLLGLIMAIAIPSALQLGGSVKDSAYETKIELIEKAGQSYGQSNLSFVKQGKSPFETSGYYYCTFTYDDETDQVKTVKKISNVSGSTPIKKTDTELPSNSFFCFTITVDQLVQSNNLDYDEKDACGGACSAEEKKYYDNVVVNPKDKSVINGCNVYVYYKYKRVYAYFDKDSCDNINEEGKFASGRAYPARRG